MPNSTPTAVATKNITTQLELWLATLRYNHYKTIYIGDDLPRVPTHFRPPPLHHGRHYRVTLADANLLA
jgi:hypothetical protein